MVSDQVIMEMQDYSFRVGEKLILDNVSFTVREGEYLAIIGPNGAGKTTLLRCLDRIYTGGEGAIFLKRKKLEDYSRRALSTLVSYVPQADGRYFPFTVREFVMMGRYPHLSPFSSFKKQDLTVVREMLALTGSADFAERNLNTLSGGERQKVFIAAALAQEGRILLLDEPTTFLDPKHQSEINALLRRLNRKFGITIVAVTHDINSAAQWSDRVLALRNGRTHYLGSAEQVMSNRVLEGVYDKSFLFVKHPQTGLPVIVPDGKTL
jgi:iron complex transport system ATP-binding protein